MQVELCMPAPPFTRFAPGSCDGNIGKPMSVLTSDGMRTGIVTAADVAHDGGAIHYTVTVIDIKIGHHHG